LSVAFDSPYARLACQRAIEAVLFGYYVDEERFLRHGGELKGQRLESVTKDNRSPQITQAEELLQELGSLGFQSCEIVRHRGLLSVPHTFCT
jgi:hypothetical protein